MNLFTQNNHSLECIAVNDPFFNGLSEFHHVLLQISMVVFLVSIVAFFAGMIRTFIKKEKCVTLKYILIAYSSSILGGIYALNASTLESVYCLMSKVTDTTVITVAQQSKDLLYVHIIALLSSIFIGLSLVVMKRKGVQVNTMFLNGMRWMVIYMLSMFSLYVLGIAHFALAQ